MESNAFNILLVEDDPDHAHLIMRELKKSGVFNTIDWVEDGSDAIDYLQCTGEYADNSISRLGLILLDIKLPKLNGLEVLQWIKNNDETKDLPVVMLTTSSDIRDIEKSYSLGANLYVEKSVENFVKRIKNIGLYCQYLNSTKE
ncbi:MAG: response regulator [Candidatus Methanofastidiosa archaeon]|jgi:CheY-like chemotaxis protein|nr:response regulator [Candidatus Methanofastidiosa archaeon]